MALAMPSMASLDALGLRCSTTLDELISPKPSAAVSSRQPGGILLREIGAIGEPGGHRKPQPAAGVAGIGDAVVKAPLLQRV